MKTESLKIIGMTCAACAKASERAVKKLEGVVEASVNFATEKMVVQYDESKLDTDKIKEAVKKAGYEAVEEAETKAIAVPISGMTCAACAKAIERAVSKLEGVESVSVNFATEKANIKYNPKATRLSEIKQAISKAGYKALEIESSNKVDEDKARKEKEIKVLWTKFIVSAIFTTPLLFYAMAHMIPGLNKSLPAFLDPMHDPLAFALVQIILVTPVIIAGYRFYTVGFRAIIRRSPNMDSLIAMGTSAAVIYSLYSTYRIYMGDHDSVMNLYFESAGGILTLILLGKGQDLRSYQEADGPGTQDGHSDTGWQGDRAPHRRGGSRRRNFG